MSTVPHDILLGRWRLTLDLFGRVFVDDVGLEPGSIISELGGFPVKEAKFRREMEKLRNSRTVDLTLSKLDRDRNNLIVQSFKEFNTHYAQNQRRSSSQPPMVVNRIKVCNNISSVVEFQRLWVLKSKLFGQESTCHQGKIFKKFLRVMTVCQEVLKLYFQSQFWMSKINRIFSKKKSI